MLNELYTFAEPVQVVPFSSLKWGKFTLLHTPKQTIDEFLITEIKLMLTFSEMSIQQIADYLHFPDQSYFGRFFKRFTGMSPQSYRKKEMTM